ncbi:hypothetical protein XELAEV_18017641mg [Xenopus laevis]|uniref:Uncharacterized protein n=1 Tax=Xenopus laevis TaxID=8355 RepID=A0A974HT67_XENLA|nr:hypothetical protein XELAEV_18017641mg [Xenopus laevis]
MQRPVMNDAMFGHLVDLAHCAIATTTEKVTFLLTVFSVILSNCIIAKLVALVSCRRVAMPFKLIMAVDVSLFETIPQNRLPITDHTFLQAGQ